MHTEKQKEIATLAVIGCKRNPQARTTQECLDCEFKNGMCDAYSHIESIYDYIEFKKHLWIKGTLK